MESKIIKVKTNGDILRDAGIISGFEVDGSEYVIYYIERDSDMDNIFTSKLIKNTDGTYNMLNIDSVNEKTNIMNIVKQMIKKSVDDTADSLNNSFLTLSDGKNVKLFSLIINKEQSIDIEKTYLTTVKKAVIEVAKKYYTIIDNSTITSSSEPVIEPITVSNVAPVANTEIVSEIPVMAEPVELIKEDTVIDKVVNNAINEEVEMPNLEEVGSSDTTTSIDEEVKNVVPELFSEPVVNPESVVLLQPEVSTESSPAIATSVVTSAPVSTPVVENVLTVDAINSPTDVSTVPVNNSVFPAGTVPVTNNVANNNDEFFAPPTENSNAVSEVPKETPVVIETPAPVVDNRIVLDGSHETNLNKALGEASDAISVSDIQAVKDFGVDETPNNNSALSANPETSANPIGNKAGFANSKFFMFVAIGFFLASCIFLGYEAFKYFQLVK